MLDPVFSFRGHTAMVLTMRALLILAFVASGLLLTDSLATTSRLDRLQTTIGEMLASNGPGSFPGDRAELYRSSDSGWEIRLIILWDGEGWQLLAARLHHPEWITVEDGPWRERLDDLLAGLDRDAPTDRPLPELLEIPAPTFLPAFPDEQRGRSFSFEGYWYEAHWINTGGLDFNAEWTLRSYDLVALP